MKENKKYFSSLLFKIFLGMVISYGLQIVFISIFSIYFPTVLENPTLDLLVTVIPLLFIGYPIFIWILKSIPVSYELEKHKMTPGQLIQAFFMAFGAMFIANIVGTIITTILSTIIGKNISVALNDVISSGVNAFVFFAYAIIVGPIFEELIFRKLIIDRIVGYGELTAIMLSAFLFGIFHGNLGQFVYAFVIGCFFGFIYIRTGNIKYTMILHMLLNLGGLFFPTLMSKYIDLNEFMNISMTEGGAAVIEYVAAHPIGLMLLMIQLVMVYGGMIVAIVLFAIALSKKKFYLVKRENDLPKGERFKTTSVNLGMCLVVLFMGAFILMQIMGWSINLKELLNL